MGFAGGAPGCKGLVEGAARDALREALPAGEIAAAAAIIDEEALVDGLGKAIDGHAVGQAVIFAITTDTFIVYTSNIMAILGLRALYFALAAMVHRFHYLKYALAAVLIFIGAKIFVADFILGGDKFPPALSLGVTFALIAAGIFYSLWKTRGKPEHDWPAGREADDPARERS